MLFYKKLEAGSEEFNSAIRNFLVSDKFHEFYPDSEFTRVTVGIVNLYCVIVITP